MILFKIMKRKEESVQFGRKDTGHEWQTEMGVMGGNREGTMMVEIDELGTEGEEESKLGCREEKEDMQVWGRG